MIHTTLETSMLSPGEDYKRVAPSTYSTNQKTYVSLSSLLSGAELERARHRGPYRIKRRLAALCFVVVPIAITVGSIAIGFLSIPTLTPEQIEAGSGALCMITTKEAQQQPNKLRIYSIHGTESRCASGYEPSPFGPISASVGDKISASVMLLTPTAFAGYWIVIQLLGVQRDRKLEALDDTAPTYAMNHLSWETLHARMQVELNIMNAAKQSVEAIDTGTKPSYSLVVSIEECVKVFEDALKSHAPLGKALDRPVSAYLSMSSVIFDSSIAKQPLQDELQRRVDEIADEFTTQIVAQVIRHVHEQRRIQAEARVLEAQRSRLNIEQEQQAEEKAIQGLIEGTRL